jgi:aspartate racemase
MKTIGLIGGITWESTKEYYRILNEETNRRLGGSHSSRCLINSLDFAEVLDTQRDRGLDVLGGLIESAGTQLASAGADIILICANTLNRFVDRVRTATGLPVLHIVDPAAAAIKEAGLDTMGLLGTRYTMEEDFIVGRYTGIHKLNILVPEPDQREAVNDIIYNELSLGIFKDSSRQVMVDIITGLQGGGAEGIILGCTEIPLLIRPSDTSLPVFDTTDLHARAAVELALGE